MHRRGHEDWSLFLAEPKLRELLDGIYEEPDRTVIVSEVLQAITSHRADGEPLSLEAGILRVADALDMPVEEATPALLRCTEDDDEYVRMRALIALSQIGEQSVVPAFLELAERSPVANYRRTAVAALGRLRAPEAETYFIRYLRDPEESDWAATWLEEIGTDASLRPLRKAAKRDPAHSDDYNKAIAAIEGRKSNPAS